MSDHTFVPLRHSVGVIAGCSCEWAGQYTHATETDAKGDHDFHVKISTPAPGTRDAIEAGCSCPVLDNSHGWGYRRKGEFIISMGCPVHAQHIAEHRGVPA